MTPTNRISQILLIVAVAATAMLNSHLPMAHAQFGRGQEVFVAFSNRSGRTVELFTADGEFLERTQHGRQTDEISFSAGERVGAFDRRAGRWIGAVTITKQGTVEISPNNIAYASVQRPFRDEVDQHSTIFQPAPPTQKKSVMPFVGLWFERLGGTEIRHEFTSSGIHHLTFLANGQTKSHRVSFDGRELTLLNGKYFFSMSGNGNLQLSNARETRLLTKSRVRVAEQGPIGGFAGKSPVGDSPLGDTQDSNQPQVPNMRRDGASLQTEIQAALNIVNAKRRELGRAPLKFNARLQNAAVRRANHMAGLARTVNSAFQASAHIFAEPGTGKMIGMNKWAREAGYRVPKYLGDENHIESTFVTGGSGGVSIRGVGALAINSFLSEGPGGGHYEAMIRAESQDFAFAAEVNASGNFVVVTVLVGFEG